MENNEDYEKGYKNGFSAAFDQFMGMRLEFERLSKLHDLWKGSLEVQKAVLTEIKKSEKRMKIKPEICKKKPLLRLVKKPRRQE